MCDIYCLNFFITGPTDKLFEQFREQFSTINVDNENLQLWTWPNPPSFLAAKAEEVVHFCQEHLLTESFGRDDYRELCELIIKYLGGQVCPF